MQVNHSATPIVCTLESPKKAILPGVPTPLFLETETEKKILPGVPTPLVEEAEMETSSKNLPGVPTPFLCMASEEIVEKGYAFLDVLERLDAVMNPPALPQGAVGGPGSVHFGAFREDILSFVQFLVTVEYKNEEDEAVIQKLCALMDAFVPAYERALDSGIHFPSEENPNTRYVDADGTEVSKEVFEGIQKDYELALAETKAAFIQGAEADFKLLFGDLFDQLDLIDPVAQKV